MIQAKRPCSYQGLFFKQLTLSGLTFRRVRKIATSDLSSSCQSVRPSAWKNWAPSGRILIKLDIYAGSIYIYIYIYMQVLSTSEGRL